MDDKKPDDKTTNETTEKAWDLKMENAPPWAERQAEIVKLLDQWRTGHANTADIRTRGTIDAIATSSYEMITALTEGGQIDEDMSRDAVLPLALMNAAIMVMRTLTVTPLGALSLLLSVFSLHSSIGFAGVVTVDGKEELSDADLQAETARIMRGTKAADAAATKADTTTGATADAGVQSEVERLMEATWSKKITVH